MWQEQIIPADSREVWSQHMKGMYVVGVYSDRDLKKTQVVFVMEYFYT